MSRLQQLLSRTERHWKRVMQEPRLSAGGARRQLADCIQVGQSAFQGPLALLDRDELEPNGVSRSSLRQNRQVSLTDHGDLRIAANRRGISHQRDRQTITRNLERSRAPRFGWQRSE